MLEGLINVTDSKGKTRTEREFKGLNTNKPIIVTLYDKTLETLANELGDCIFSVERTKEFYLDRDLPYLEQSTTQFSFDYEDWVKNPTKNKKPDSKEY